MTTWDLYCAIHLEHLVVLGYKCSTVSCNEVARFTAFWPGQTGVKCAVCTEHAKRFAEVMGFELQTRELDVVVGRDDTVQRFAMMELT